MDDVEARITVHPVPTLHLVEALLAEIFCAFENLRLSIAGSVRFVLGYGPSRVRVYVLWGLWDLDSLAV